MGRKRRVLHVEPKPGSHDRQAVIRLTDEGAALVEAVVNVMGAP